MIHNHKLIDLQDYTTRRSDGDEQICAIIIFDRSSQVKASNVCQEVTYELPLDEEKKTIFHEKCILQVLLFKAVLYGFFFIIEVKALRTFFFLFLFLVPFLRV